MSVAQSSPFPGHAGASRRKPKPARPDTDALRAWIDAQYAFTFKEFGERQADAYCKSLESQKFHLSKGFITIS
jgi:hypothetical protein